jgi:hypothetical protein
MLVCILLSLLCIGYLMPFLLVTFNQIIWICGNTLHACFNNSLFSFLELCLMTVMSVAVACVLDAIVCICDGVFVDGV